MKKTTLIIGSVGLVILGSVFAFGASGGPGGWCHGKAGGFSPVGWGRHHDGQYRMDLISEILDLDAAQKEKLRAVHNTMQEGKQAFSQIRLQTLDELLDQVSGESLDQDRIRQMVQRHQSIVDAFAPQVIAKIAEFHAVLTPDQKAKAAEFMTKWKNRMERWQEHHT